VRDCWGVVPAAGLGRRMGADRPKQYLEIGGRTVLEHAIRRLASHPRVRGVTVCLAGNDPYWPALAPRLPAGVATAAGGPERADSVFNGLEALRGRCRPDDWVLVHDAARPCLRPGDVDALIRAVEDWDGAGGLLALPMADTVKRAGPDGAVLETVPREGLWRALTPQIFRFNILYQALENALKNALRVTDEASAVEAVGGRVRLVAGHPDNIKITHREDLELARAILAAQHPPGDGVGP